MRRPAANGGTLAAGGRLKGESARAVHAIFERGQLLEPDRAARVHPAGRDADLGAETELAAIGELRRGIVHHNGRIDFLQEARRRRLVLGDDAIGMMRAKGLDMGDGLRRGHRRRARQ